jgi:hypothetical protein
MKDRKPSALVPALVGGIRRRKDRVARDAKGHSGRSQFVTEWIAHAPWALRKIGRQRRLELGLSDVMVWNTSTRRQIVRLAKEGDSRDNATHSKVRTRNAGDAAERTCPYQ